MHFVTPFPYKPGLGLLFIGQIGQLFEQFCNFVRQSKRDAAWLHLHLHAQRAEKRAKRSVLPPDQAEVSTGQQVEKCLQDQVGEDKVRGGMHSAYPGFGGTAEERGEEEEAKGGEIEKGEVDAEEQRKGNRGK